MRLSSKEIVVESNFHNDELNKLTETLTMTISYEDATDNSRRIRIFVKSVPKQN